MALETATYISDLVSTNPTSSDNISQGDDHIRLLKATVKATFPNVSGAVTPTHTELNYVDGVTSAIQTQLDAKAASGANTDLTSVYLNNTGLKIKDTNASHGLIVAPGSDLTADRTLTLTTGDAARTVTISGNATISQDYSSTGNPQFATLELGHASDTTLSRVSAGVAAIEGKNIALNGTGETWTTGTIELGHASDTTLSRSAAGALAVEGNLVPSPASQAHGDVLYRGASGWERLAAGTSGQFLKTLGAGAAPVWDAVASGGSALLGTLSTASGSNPVLSNLDLTSYKFLAIAFDDVKYIVSGGASRHYLLGTSTSDDIQFTIVQMASNSSGLHGFGIIELNSGFSMLMCSNSGSQTTAATPNSITNLKFPFRTSSTSVSIALSGTGNFQGGSILVYGVK